MPPKSPAPVPASSAAGETTVSGVVKQLSWRGRRKTAAAATASMTQHRWQQTDWSQQQARVLQQRTLWHNLKITALGSLSVALMALFIWLLIFSPVKTVFIGVAATEYAWPLPPNAWAREDLSRFNVFSNQTMDVFDLSKNWRSKETGIRQLKQTLRDKAEASSHREAVVIYLSVHGAANASGEPCLLTPESWPTQTDTWMPLRDILETIKAEKLSEDLHLLLILDCSRVGTNWSVGQLHAGFADRLAEVVQNVNVPNLVILNSTAEGQVGWSAPELGGSAFGFFVRQALQGSADSWQEGGDGDRRVSLDELHRYVRRHVRQWVRQHRQDDQTPILLPAKATNFSVAWNYGGKIPTLEGAAKDAGVALPAVGKGYSAPSFISTPAVSAPTVYAPRLTSSGLTAPQITGPYVSRPYISPPMVSGPYLSSTSIDLSRVSKAAAANKKDAAEEAGPTKLPGRSVDEDALEVLWMQHDELANRRVYSRDPLGWRNFEHQLLRLEQLAEAGRTYRTEARTTLASVQDMADKLAQPSTIETLPAHSLTLAQRFGRIPESDAELQTIAANLAAQLKPKAPPAAPPMGPAPAAPMAPMGPVLPGAGTGGGGDATPASSPAAAASTAAPQGTAAKAPAAGNAPAGAAPSAGPLPAAPPAPAAAGDDKTPSYAARVYAAWVEFQQNGGSEVSLKDLVQYIGPPSTDFEPGLIEGHYLVMLNRFLDTGDNPVDPQLLRTSAQSRAFAELAATPLDPRTFYWARGAVDTGDVSRRQAEDKLFVGEPADLKGLPDLWNKSETKYADAMQATNTAAIAVAIRDQTWAELPYIAQWMCRRLPADQQASVGAELDRKINQQLLPLINRSQLLASALEESLSLGGTDTSLFSDHAQAVQNALDQLKQDFKTECDRLVGKVPRNEQTLRDILAVLSCPLVPAGQRKELRRTAAEIAYRLHADYPALVTNGDDSAESDDVDSADGKETDKVDYLDRVALLWDQHPAVALLSRFGLSSNSGDQTPTRQISSGDSDDRVMVVASLGQQVRQQLETAQPQVQAWLADSDARMLDPQRTEADVRLLRGQAERLLRSYAPLAFVTPEIDPIAANRELDLHNLLTWQARRTMEEFWGPAQVGGESYFHVASADYLDSAQKLAVRETRLRPAQDDALWKRLTELRQASLNGIRTATEDLLLIGTESQVTRSLEVRVSGELPPGDIALWLRDSRGPTLPVLNKAQQTIRRMELEVGPNALPTRRAELPYAIDVTALAGMGPRMETVGLYRGHEYANLFYAQPSSGTEVTYTPPAPTPTRLTVFGNVTQRGSTVFILDCSHSMNAPATVEGPGTAKTPITRLNVAVQAFKDMLSYLADEGRFHVGVRFYGHRVGRNIAMPAQILTAPNYGGTIPEGLLPSEDVEQVLTLGRFTPVQNQQVTKLLDTLEPWGETPLYKAIEEALTQDFVLDDPFNKRSIVVVTDGLNYQFNSPRPRSRQDVLAALQKHKIPIYIVGFGIDPGDRAQAEREFGEVAARSGGAYFPANDATTLSRALFRSLGPSEFRVKDLDGNHGVGQDVVGEPVVIPARPPEPREYQVELKTDENDVTSTLKLMGGEAIELFLSDDARTLDAQRYLRGNPKFSDPVPTDPSAKTRFLVGAHRPDWNGPTLTFPISFQQANAKLFSPPPAEIWLEIAPVLPAGPGQPYVFSDLMLEQRRPCPIELCKTSDWPADANTAEVRAWWKYNKTAPTLEVTVDEAMKLGPDGTPNLKVPGVSDINYHVQIHRANGNTPLRVVVLEAYTPQATDLRQMKLEMVPQPATMRHRYDRNNRIAIHTFEFPGIDEELVRKNYKLVFTTKRSLHSNAFQLKDALEVYVPELPDLIRP